MDIEFRNDEKLFRAVWPESKVPDFWKEDGSLSYAALRDRKGLSVERTGLRTSEETLETFCKEFRGDVVSITVGSCYDVKALVVLKPTERSKYHTEIHGSEDRKLLSKTQASYLAEKAVIELKRDIQLSQ